MLNHHLSVEEARRYLGIGRTTLYRLITQGHLRSIQIGSRRLFPRAELDRFSASLMAEA